jgi:hypothetical protein
LPTSENVPRTTASRPQVTPDNLHGEYIGVWDWHQGRSSATAIDPAVVHTISQPFGFQGGQDYLINPLLKILNRTAPEKRRAKH